MRKIRTLSSLPRYIYQGRTNDCGPSALAMALTSLVATPPNPSEVNRRLRPWRVPFVGATLPWGVMAVARSFGVKADGHWLGRIGEIERAIDRGRAPVVIVHPDDFGVTPFFTLHYRVVVGYEKTGPEEQDGRLYFACSALPERELFGESDGLARPGNLALDYRDFMRQWHTYLTIRFWAELTAVCVISGKSRRFPGSGDRLGYNAMPSVFCRKRRSSQRNG